MTWKDIGAGLLDKNKLQSLPESFLFGVATSDHQCEAYDPKYEDIRDIWEREINPDAARGRASDFWNRYQEDIELAKGLGCNAFRFSIAWSRVEPVPGQFNQEALDHYEDLIDKIRSCGMQPILTLHHFTWPVHVEERGGMICDQFPTMYAFYVREIAKRFGRDVPYWITFHEPNLLIGSYLKPWWRSRFAAPPGIDGVTNAEVRDIIGRLTRNLFLSHKEAYEIIKSINPHAQVGVNAYVFGLPMWLQKLVNRSASVLKSSVEAQAWMKKLVERRAQKKRWITGWLMANLFEKNRVDVVLATLTKTAEREQEVMFSEPYFTAGQQLLVKSGSFATYVRDLEEEPIAVVESSVAEKNFSMLIRDAKALTVSDYRSALEEIDLGRVKALLGDNTILHGLMTQYPGKYRLINTPLTQDESYAGAVKKGENDLLKELDSIIIEFKGSPIWLEWSSILSELPLRRPPRAKRALTISPTNIESAQRIVEQIRKRQKISSDPMPLAPEGTAMRRIQDRGFLIAAIKSDIPGLSFMNPETKEFSGLEVDLARSLASFIFGDANKVHFHPVTIKDRIPLIQLGWLDALQIRYDALFTPLYLCDWWHMGMAGELDEYLCPLGCAGMMDFVGLDSFWGISTPKLGRIQSLIDAAHYGRFARAPVYERGLYNNLKHYQQKFPWLPLIIFGNGSLEVVDGVSRVSYIRRHIREIQRAVQEGAIVCGYIYSSLTSQSDWDSRFGEANDFGLFHIDLDYDPSLSRMRTPSADAYEEIIRKRGA